MDNKDNATRQDDLCSVVQHHLMATKLPQDTLACFIEAMRSPRNSSSTKRQDCGEKNKQITVTLHGNFIGDILRKMGSNIETDEGLSNGIKLVVQRNTTKSRSKSAPKECRKGHAEKFVRCSVGVVYRIPMSCGKMYVGQTGRCVNERLAEHKKNFKKPNKSSTLREHRQSCGSRCEPVFEQTTVSLLHPDKFMREVIEALEIAIFGDKCFSRPSVSLTITPLTCAEEKQHMIQNGYIGEQVIDVHGNATEEHYGETPSFEDNVRNGIDRDVKADGNQDHQVSKTEDNARNAIDRNVKADGNEDHHVSKTMEPAQKRRKVGRGPEKNLK